MCPLRKQTFVVRMPLQSGSDLHAERLEMKWNTAVKVPNTLGRDRVLGSRFSQSLSHTIHAINVGVFLITPLCITV